MPSNIFIMPRVLKYVIYQSSSFSNKLLIFGVAKNCFCHVLKHCTCLLRSQSSPGPSLGPHVREPEATESLN